jgi:hypothetical protein
LLDEERARLNAATSLQAQGQARTKGNEAAEHSFNPIESGFSDWKWPSGWLSSSDDEL